MARELKEQQGEGLIGANQAKITQISDASSSHSSSAAFNGYGTTTIIGRFDDLQRFDDDPNIDTWRRSGRIPIHDEAPVTWAENKNRLDERIARGDNFGIATDPSKLPPVRGGYVPGVPNGYFTARELEYLISCGIEILDMFK